MKINVHGHDTYCYTGGKTFDISQPTLILIHGALNDHSVWALQSRYLANHGWNVLALDLPGHCKSEGDAPETVEQAADFVAALMDSLGLERAALVGHSWGSLIALETASRLKNRISHLILVGTAFPMKVSQALLDAALHEPDKGIALINTYMRSTLAPPPSVLGPGTWVIGASTALNHRVLASNKGVNLFYRDFKACDLYTHGEVAMQEITCPVLFVLGAQDQMTTARSAQGLIDIANATGKKVEVIRLKVGHHQMAEAPEETLFAIRDFLR